MSIYVQTNQIVQLNNADTVILASDTGKLMLIPALTVGQKTYTLPAAQAGLHYRFMTNATPTQIAAITSAVAGTVQGAVMNTNTGALNVTTLVALTNANSANFTANALRGTYIDAYCDGVNWHMTGLSRHATGLS